MKKEKVTYILFGVFLIMVVGVMTCGDSSDTKATPALKPVEKVKEIVEEKVKEVKADVEEKVEEVKVKVEEKVEEVKEKVEEKVEEVIKEIIPIKLPDLPKLEEIIPDVEEAPIEVAPVEVAPVEEVEEEVEEEVTE